VRLSVRLGGIFALAAVAFSAQFNSRAMAGEPLDNSTLIHALESGISTDVLSAKIDSYFVKGTAGESEKSAQLCHFDASIDALVKVKEAAEKGGWTKDDIAKLQKRMIVIADGDKKRLTGLVSVAMNTFENMDPNDYESMMRQLKKEGKVVAPYILEQIEQESDRKRAGMLDALGQIGDKSDAVVKQAIFMLTDRAKPVRLEAAKCVAKLFGPNTCDDLIARLSARDEKLDGVCMALGYLCDPKAEEALTHTLRYAFDSDTRVCAAFALGQLRAKSQGAREELLSAVLDEHDEKLRDSAANALGLIGERRTPGYIKRAFERYRPGREDILKHLASFKCAESVEFLLQQVENDAPKIKRSAQDTLQILTGENLAGADEWKSWWEVTKFRPDWIQVDSGSKVPEPGSAVKPAESDPITTTR